MSKKLRCKEPLYILADGSDQLCFSFEEPQPSRLRQTSMERGQRVQLWRTYTLKGAPALGPMLVRGLRERGLSPASAPPLTISKRGILHLVEESFRYGWRAWGEYRQRTSIPPCDAALCWKHATPHCCAAESRDRHLAVESSTIRHADTRSRFHGEKGTSITQ